MRAIQTIGLLELAQISQLPRRVYTAVPVRQWRDERRECPCLLYYGSGAAYTTQTTTIHYTYDPLQRLTGASYSGATTYTFAYAYDAVGNRTIQTQTITSTLVTTYTYDAANRLTNVNTLAGTGSQAYTWDNNPTPLRCGDCAATSRMMAAKCTRIHKPTASSQ